MKSKASETREPSIIEAVSSPERLPVRAEPTLSLPADATVDQWHHNFDLASDDGKAALINASNVPDWIPSDSGTVRLRVVHYLAYPDEYVDRKTGEIVHATACVFVGHDGRVAKFLNHWSLRRLHAMIRLYTPEQWAAGVEIECYASPSRQQGRTYGSFRIVRAG